MRSLRALDELAVRITAGFRCGKRARNHAQGRDKQKSAHA